MEDSPSSLSSQSAQQHDTRISSPLNRRSKRGRYTPVACNECKKRKLKCIPTGDDNCQRCIAGGIACVFGSRPQPQATKTARLANMKMHVLADASSHHHVRALTDEMAQLRQQVTDLAESVRELRENAEISRPQNTSCVAAAFATSPSNVGSRDNAPKHPHFIGPTRPAYGLVVAERSLTRMGIQAPDSAKSTSLSSSRADSPLAGEAMEDDGSPATDAEFWASCTPDEVARLLAVFEEEVESVYPFVDTIELASRAEQILRRIRNPDAADNQAHDRQQAPLSSLDVDMVKLAVATAVAVEAHGKTALSASIAESVEDRLSRISRSQVELKGIQLLTMLSIYHFHCDDELLAWRTIGVAAREALEMGLHRRRSLFDNFRDAHSRRDAMRVLSFALADRDIDPALPEPDADLAYLRCMISYARLCSKIWDAIPPFGSPSPAIPTEDVHALDLSTQVWLDSIPAHLQIRHPRMLGATGSNMSQPRVLHRLRALLYLRGNYTRISIYQHYLLSPASIQANLSSARLVVDIARDTVQVLVHLNATTDVYSRQQNAFNYFLLSAFAVMTLAVCHAPHHFAKTCRESLLQAIELVKGFSRHSVASRRLWNSIRELLPRLKSLQMQSSEGPQADSMLHATGNHIAAGSETRREASADMDAPMDLGQFHDDGGMQLSLIPEMTEFSSDLLDLFDTLGQGQNFGDSFGADFYDPSGGFEMQSDGLGISRRFLQGLM
ncbi:hypothetical protein PLIIFM63780_001639 [Purpureocillium lilacinum]|nr:hypothetical protein PLIIFM63780_001639 [Purpureocillium lilacinum]